jgi:hypothetical protein
MRLSLNSWAAALLLAPLLAPIPGCGKGSNPPPVRAAADAQEAALRSAARELSSAAAALHAVHSPGDLPAAREALDQTAARIDALTEQLKAGPRPGSDGYQRLRAAGDGYTAQLRKFQDEERRAAGALGAEAPELARATRGARDALGRFQSALDPEHTQTAPAEDPAAAPGAPAGPSGAGTPPRESTPGPFGPSRPQGRPADPREADRQSLAAFRAAHDASKVMTVEIDGIPPERLGDLSWRLRAQTGATVHAHASAGTHATVLLYPVPDVAAAARLLDVGTVSRTDPVARTVYIQGDPSKLP